jgi:hypothetical protein
MVVAVALAVGLALTAIPSAGEEAGAEAEGPRIRFDVYTHDFGPLRSDERREYAWVYHNDGDAPLSILQTYTSCGCTAAVLDGESVPPGGSGVLTVAFEAAGLRGSIRKSIAVASNDPSTPRLLLTVTADILEEKVVREEGSHPPIAGQSILVGECATCHAKPAGRKTGEDLYAAVCAMCHGPAGEGRSTGPALGTAEYLAAHSDREIGTAIAYGTANPRMPGFIDLMGGPLSQDQIDSLVEFVREWEARDR